ncbi:MAG: thioredoxin family protein [Verrucomicrobiaceae bacterium]|nr:thioredoxin family protein [Verrucomicrobiaceae bacterium]
MKKLLTLLLAAATITSLASDFPKGSPTFKSSATSAINAAKKEGKPVILVFSAAWCPPCQAMKKDVYPSAAVKAYHDKFVWAYLDVDDGSNRRAAEKAGVSGIPHIQFLDAQGNEIGKQVGGNSPEAFAKTLESMLAKAGSSAAK